MTNSENEVRGQIDKIKAALQDRNLRRVARATGLHHNTLGNLMKGGKTPSVKTIEALQKYLFQAG